jgi:hypothetical protein
MGRFPAARPKTEPRNPWAADLRTRLADWLDEHAPERAHGMVAGNGGVDVHLGSTKVATFLPTATGLSVYLHGTSDTDVKRIERLCERAGVPEEIRPPRTSKYVLIKVADDDALEHVAEALRLHSIGRG